MSGKSSLLLSTISDGTKFLSSAILKRTKESILQNQYNKNK